MRTQTQCNGIWQNSADGSIMYADTAHGVLWVRHVTDTTETWDTKHIAASNLRGYLAAMRENGWLMVSANADVVPNADAYNAWRADMFPHGIPRRVTDYEAAVYDRRLVACEEDAADGWTCPSPSCVSHPLTREAAAMVRMTMRGDCDVSADADDDFDVPTPAEDAQAVAESEPAGPRAALYRSTCDSAGNDYTLVVDGSGLSGRDAASFVADYIRDNIRPNFRNEGMESAFRVTTDARVRVMVKICGVGGVRAEVEYHRRDAEVSYRCFTVWAESADYFGKATRDGGVTDAWDKTVTFARGIEIALKRDKLIHKHDGNECAALVETYGEAIGYKDASTYDERVVSLPVGGFIEPGASDVPGVPSETVTAVPAEPRTVESAPVLPAECSAVTQEIPEVPPQANEDAHVLAISESVMITGKSVADLFPDVSYRTVRYFKRAVTKKDGTVALKKVAAVFKHGDTVHVLRRDRYIKAGRDQAVEAEIAAYVAKLRKAA